MTTDDIRPYFGLPQKRGIRLEEEEEEGSAFSFGSTYPPTYDEDTQEEQAAQTQEQAAQVMALYSQILDERQQIIRAITEGDISKEDATGLLQENQQVLSKIIEASKPRKRQTTENVARNILIFAAVVLAFLAVLNVWAYLPTDITLAFLGTTLGGTIATIAQKLGKL